MDDIKLSPNRLLLLVTGFTLWAVAFIVLYATNAIGCAFNWPEGVQRMVLVGLTLGFVAATAALAYWHLRHRRRAEVREPRLGPSLAQIGLYAAVAACVATLGSLVPSVAISMCI